jgi:hypothetical protein
MGRRTCSPASRVSRQYCAEMLSGLSTRAFCIAVDHTAIRLSGLSQYAESDGGSLTSKWPESSPMASMRRPSSMTSASAYPDGSNLTSTMVSPTIWRFRLSRCLTVLVKIGIIPLLIIALFASPAFAQSDRAYRLALAGAVTAHGLDLSTSSHCLGAGTCRELNPILRPLSDTPLAFGAAKMGIAAASLLATDALRRRGHRKAAFWIAVGQGIAFTYIAVRNVRATAQ